MPADTQLLDPATRRQAGAWPPGGGLDQVHGCPVQRARRLLTPLSRKQGDPPRLSTVAAAGLALRDRADPALPLVNLSLPSLAMVGIRRRAISARADLFHHPLPCQTKMKKKLTREHEPAHFRQECIPSPYLPRTSGSCEPPMTAQIIPTHKGRGWVAVLLPFIHKL
jgi:hypothetical protein